MVSPTNLARTFGVNVRRECKRQGLSVHELGRECAMDGAAISRVENAERDLRLSTVERVAGEQQDGAGGDRPAQRATATRRSKRRPSRSDAQDITAFRLPAGGLAHQTLLVGQTPTKPLEPCLTSRGSLVRLSIATNIGAMADMQAGVEARIEADPHESDGAPGSQGSLGALAGVWRGRVWIADDFDELPDDVAESFGISS